MVGLRSLKKNMKKENLDEFDKGGKMIKIKQQVVNVDDICTKVLDDIFGEGYEFSMDEAEYDTLYTIVEKTLISVSENPEEYCCIN